MINLKKWLSTVHHESYEFGAVTNGDRLGFFLVLAVCITIIILK